MRWIIAVVGLSLLVAACGTSTAVPTSAPELPAPTESEAVSEQSPTEAPAVQNTEPARAESEAPMPTAAVRDELQATDPTTVNIGNGNPTLVEFFAFW